MSLGFNKLSLISNDLFCLSDLNSTSQLFVLNLNDNHIKSLEFLSKQFQFLENLNLEWNFIEILNLSDFKALSHLQSLNINNNKLLSIEASFFLRLDLKQIDSSSVMLKTWRLLDLDEFSVNVQKIDLSFNNFESISLTKTLHDLTDLSLRGTNISSLLNLNSDFIYNLDLSEISISRI